jgi:hypothetical protein
MNKINNELLQMCVTKSQGLVQLHQIWFLDWLKVGSIELVHIIQHKSALSSVLTKLGCAKDRLCNELPGSRIVPG